MGLIEEQLFSLLSRKLKQRTKQEKLERRFG
jgi:hypothetical protein